MSNDKPFGFGGSQSTGTAKTATPSPRYIYGYWVCGEVRSLSSYP
ncbi:hypothetical protein [Nostoc sp. 'Peltigera membranacea cyanobiont' 210A]|nr:hypothetical protein [Nostoc sp. 'Peltigera membranacea cyanobiont' 210A]